MFPKVSYSYHHYQQCIKARFHNERGKDYSLFILLIFLLCLALASILSAERSIKETKNALFHAGSGNGLLVCLLLRPLPGLASTTSVQWSIPFLFY